jgi:hypothetical protein
MTSTSRLRKTILAALFALTTTTSADAQIGGLIKRKATDAIKGPEKNEEKAAAKSTPFGNPDILEITAPRFEGLLRGLKVEVALYKEFTAELAKYPTPQQYNRCAAQVYASPEKEKLLEIMMLPDNATDAQKQAAMKKYGEEDTALLKRKCPLDPATWTDSKKQERLTEITARAAAAAVPAASHDEDAFASGPYLSSDEPGRQAEPAPTTLQYDNHKERTDKLCKLRTQNVLPKTGGFKTPGAGSAHWLFEPGELSVMDSNNCERFDELYEQLKPPAARP